MTKIKLFGYPIFDSKTEAILYLFKEGKLSKSQIRQKIESATGKCSYQLIDITLKKYT